MGHADQPPLRPVGRPDAEAPPRPGLHHGSHPRRAPDAQRRSQLLLREAGGPGELPRQEPAASQQGRDQHLAAVLRPPSQTLQSNQGEAFGQGQEGLAVAAVAQRLHDPLVQELARQAGVAASLAEARPEGGRLGVEAGVSGPLQRCSDALLARWHRRGPEGRRSETRRGGTSAPASAHRLLQHGVQRHRGDPGPHRQRRLPAAARRPEDHVQHYTVVAAVPVVSVGAPAPWPEVDLHVAPEQFPRLGQEQGVPEVRPCVRAGAARVEHP